MKRMKPPVTTGTVTPVTEAMSGHGAIARLVPRMAPARYCMRGKRVNLPSSTAPHLFMELRRSTKPAWTSKL